MNRIEDLDMKAGWAKHKNAIYAEQCETAEMASEKDAVPFACDVRAEVLGRLFPLLWLKSIPRR